MCSSSSQFGTTSLADEFRDIWNCAASVDLFDFLAAHADANRAARLEVLLIDQSERLHRGVELPVEWYLENFSDIAINAEIKLRFVLGEFNSACQRCDHAAIESCIARFPEFRLKLLGELERYGLDLSAREVTLQTVAAPGLASCVDICVSAGENVFRCPPAPLSKIGRYSVKGLIGSGGFGRVFLGHDSELDRLVAIKIPRDDRYAGGPDREQFIREAQLLALLEHPGIVPVYDVGRDANGSCFVVSKYVDGCDLRRFISESQPTPSEAAKIIFDVSDALDFAHSRRIVHRDIKPANILLDKVGNAYLADFGIALRDEIIEEDGAIVGTLAYMSPEQLRGESHLVDRRSDIFSLGAVFYELLTGRRPFPTDFLRRTAMGETPAPRQFNDRLPRELERICLKALNNRAADRYATAREFADDLQHWLKQSDDFVASRALSKISRPPLDHGETAALRIVPRGLRFFDVDDAYFFHRLIPGPRNRDGLPDILGFWKSRIESRDPEGAFRVGLIFGPSGCGKSSFLRAGVLPHLEQSVTVLFVESTADNTEYHLRRKLLAICPGIPQKANLADLFAQIRRGEHLPSQQKLLIVFDQFEQWLHSRNVSCDNLLVDALRQCDGSRLQCIIGVRDDFWVSITEFMRDLEVELVLGRNVAPLQLLNRQHARNVLVAIGRAYGAIPTGDLNKDHSEFVDQVIDELASENNRIVPVRLALVAEMCKERAWTPETLATIGGFDAIGVAFLEDSFSSRSAAPQHRIHQIAARNVLRLLLPEEDATIKGEKRSYSELLAASGYADKPADFNTVLRILDNDLRLITPTDANEDKVDSDHSQRHLVEHRYYHLTHDYLVPPLRQWLRQKQRQSLCGRAELRLAECAAAWKSRPNPRNLPSAWEWLIMSLLLKKVQRNSPARQELITAATKYYVLRCVLISAILILGFSGAFYRLREANVQALIRTLRTARLSDTPTIIAKLIPYGSWAKSPLTSIVDDNRLESSERLRVRMALLPFNPGVADSILHSLLECEPDEFLTLLGWMRSNEKAVRQGLPFLDDELYRYLSNIHASPSLRIRAGMALASFDPDRLFGDKTTGAATFLAAQLIEDATTDPSSLGSWLMALKPIHRILLRPLSTIFRESSHADTPRSQLAAVVLADYAGDRVDVTAELLLDASPAQHRLLTTRSKAWSNPQLRDCLLTILRRPTSGHSRDLQLKVLKDQSHARALLLLLGAREFATSTLKGSSDPTARTYLEARLSLLTTVPQQLLSLLSSASDADLRASIVRILGGMDLDKLENDVVAEGRTLLLRLYEQDIDPAVHSAAEWALLRWEASKQLREADKRLRSFAPLDGRHWYIDAEEHTFALIEGPVETLVGSPEHELGRDTSDESEVPRRIPRSFAVSTKETTVAQFRHFLPQFRHQQSEVTVSHESPITGVAWYRAAQYCLWLSIKEGLPESQWCYHPVDKYDIETLRTPENVAIAGYVEPYPDYLSRTGYRLPSEAEWEYACRATTKTPYSWGLDPLMADGYAWYIGTSQGLNHPVGFLRPNDFGLFDMHGNVAEWMHDAYIEKRDSREIDDLEDLSSTTNDRVMRVTRGATAIDSNRYLRAANRTPTNPVSRPSLRCGFRIVRTIENYKRKVKNR
jgi:serine/threonine protein kinase/formylglycine-generating enzyme required for sulfatase activity